MIDITRLTIKAGDTVQCKPSNPDSILDREGSVLHSPGYTPGKIFVVDHFVINGMNQLLYDNTGQYVYSTEVVIYDKKEELPLTVTERNKIALERILEIVFPGEWDLSLSEGKLTIHFKEVEIKNSRNERHLIRDLYVIVQMNSDGTLRSSNITGMRATLTESELSCGYRHSHLGSTRDFTGYSNFCTGGDMISELGLLLRNKNVFENEDMYENYFETLKTYVAWESIEGGPYISIASITSTIGSDFNYGSNPPDNTSYSIIQKCMSKYGIDIPVSLNITEDNKLESMFKLVSVDKDKLKKELLDAVLEDLDEYSYERILVLKVAGTEYRSRNGVQPFKSLLNIPEDSSKGEEVVQVHSTDSGYQFKGERILYRKLRELKKQTYTKNNIDISTGVLDNFITRSLTKFYGKFFESGIETTSDSDNLEHKSSLENIETI